MRWNYSRNFIVKSRLSAFDTEGNAEALKTGKTIVVVNDVLIDVDDI